MPVPAGLSAVIVVSLTTVTSVAAVVPKSTAVAPEFRDTLPNFGTPEFRGQSSGDILSNFASSPASCGGCDYRALVGSSVSQQFGNNVGHVSPMRRRLNVRKRTT